MLNLINEYISFCESYQLKSIQEPRKLTPNVLNKITIVYQFIIVKKLKNFILI